MALPRLYCDADTGDRFVAHWVSGYPRWRERFRPRSVPHRLVWLAQGCRVPVETAEDAYRNVRRWRAISPQGAAGSHTASWRALLRGARRARPDARWARGDDECRLCGHSLATCRCDDRPDATPLSEFHRDRKRRDGLRRECKPCVRERIDASIARRRAEMGEEAWAEHQRQITARSRAKTGNASGKAYAAAYRTATAALVDRHRAEFEHLLTLARRGELADKPAEVAS